MAQNCRRSRPQSQLRSSIAWPMLSAMTWTVAEFRQQLVSAYPCYLPPPSAKRWAVPNVAPWLR